MPREGYGIRRGLTHWVRYCCSRVASATIQPAAGAPSSTTKPQIAKLPSTFEGRWERTLPSLQTISNMTKFTITSQDENGKLLGKFTSWGISSSRCSTVLDVPMEGE